MNLSQSNEDYLEAIYILKSNNQKAKPILISRMLNVSKPAVTRAMNHLLKSGYVLKTPYSEIELTEEGAKIAKNVYHRHLVIHEFLENTLGLPHSIAEKDCCKIEHVISKETLKAIERLNK